MLQHCRFNTKHHTPQRLLSTPNTSCHACETLHPWNQELERSKSFYLNYRQNAPTWKHRKIEDQLEVAVTPNTKVYKARNNFSTHTAHKCNTRWILMREHPQSWLFFRDRTGQQDMNNFLERFILYFSLSGFAAYKPAKIAFQNTGRVTLTMRVIKSQQLFS